MLPTDDQQFAAHVAGPKESVNVPGQFVTVNGRIGRVDVQIKLFRQGHDGFDFAKILFGGVATGARGFGKHVGGLGPPRIDFCAKETRQIDAAFVALVVAVFPNAALFAVPQNQDGSFAALGSRNLNVVLEVMFRRSQQEFVNVLRVMMRRRRHVGIQVQCGFGVIGGLLGLVRLGTAQEGDGQQVDHTGGVVGSVVVVIVEVGESRHPIVIVVPQQSGDGHDHQTDRDGHANGFATTETSAASSSEDDATRNEIGMVVTAIFDRETVDRRRGERIVVLDRSSRSRRAVAVGGRSQQRLLVVVVLAREAGVVGGLIGHDGACISVAYILW